MPAIRVIEIIERNLTANAARVARAVVGPRREGWFNSEAFVALMEAVGPLEDGGFSVYGEESFNTVLQKLNWPVAGGAPRALPDLVGYGADENAPPVFILEAKLVYEHDVDRGLSAVKTLSAQLANARAILPGVPLIGLVYAVKSPHHGNAERFYHEVSTFMETELATNAGFDWVGGQPLHQVEGLRETTVNFPGFTCYSSVGLGARVAR